MKASPLWQLLGTIITAAATVAVAYFAALKPAANEAVQENIRNREQEVAQGIPVAINSRPIKNDTGYRLLLIGFCNATADSKEVEVWIGSAEDQMRLVASESGTDRLTVTCVVPSQWYYRVSYRQVPQGGCDVTAWKI